MHIYYIQVWSSKVWQPVSIEGGRNQALKVSLAIFLIRVVISIYTTFILRPIRIAMLAAFGWPVSELYHYKIAQSVGLDSFMNGDGRAPSVLNGGLDNVYALLGLGMLERTTIAILLHSLSTIHHVLSRPFLRSGQCIGAGAVSTKERESPSLEELFRYVERRRLGRSGKLWIW